METHRCEFCGSTFKSSNNLITHKKSAKYCLNQRSITAETRKCKWCDKSFSYQASLSRHMLSCKTNRDNVFQRLNDKIEQLEDEADQLRDEADQLRDEKKQLEEEIISLKLLLENGKGQIKVYKERPGVVNNTQYINPKLLNIKCDTIHPLTLEYVQQEADDGKYSYENYIKGEKGLVDFIAGLISEDDQRSYVCTDAARNKFHRLIETREWKEDNGANFLNKIFDSLKEPASTYYGKITNMLRVPEEQETGDFLMDKTKKMFFGITDPKSKDREDLFNRIRANVRKLASI